MPNTKFSYEFTLPFRYADPVGIMFFGNIFDLAHDALERFVVDRGFEWSEWFAHPEYGAPIRHAEADYRQPLQPGNVYTCEVEVLEASHSSLTLQFSFLHANRLCASVKLVPVFVERKNMTKCAIPEEFRKRLV